MRPFLYMLLILISGPPVFATCPVDPPDATCVKYTYSENILDRPDPKGRYPQSITKTHCVCLGRFLKIEQPLMTNGGDVILAVDELEIGSPIDTRPYIDHSASDVRGGSFSSAVQNAVNAYYSTTPDAAPLERDPEPTGGNLGFTLRRTNLYPEAPQGFTVRPVGSGRFATASDLEPVILEKALFSGHITVIANRVKLCPGCEANPSDPKPIFDLHSACSGSAPPPDTSLFMASSIRPARRPLAPPYCTANDSSPFCSGQLWQSHLMNWNSLDTVGAAGEIFLSLSGIGNQVSRNDNILERPAEQLRNRSNRSVLAAFPSAFLARDFPNCSILPGGAPPYCCFPKAKNLRVAPGLPQVAEVSAGDAGNGYGVKQAIRQLVRAFARLERPSLDVRQLNEELMIRGIPNSYSPTDQLSIFFWDIHIGGMARLAQMATSFPEESPGQLLPAFLSGYQLESNDVAGLNEFQSERFEKIVKDFSPSIPGRAVHSFLRNVDGLANYGEEDPVARFEFAAAQGAASRLEQRVLELNADLVSFQLDFFKFIAENRLREMQSAVSAVEKKLRETQKLAETQGYEELARILGGAVEDVQDLWGAVVSYDWKEIGERLGDLIAATGDVKDILDSMNSVDELEEAYRQILERQTALRAEIDQAKQAFVAKISSKEGAARLAQANYYSYASNAKRLAEDLFRLIIVNFAKDNSGQARDRLKRRLAQLHNLVQHYPNTTFDPAGLNKFPAPCQGTTPDLCSILSSTEFADCVRLPASSDGYTVSVRSDHQVLPAVDLLGVSGNSSPTRRHLLGAVLGQDLRVDPGACNDSLRNSLFEIPVLDSSQTIDLAAGEHLRQMWSIEGGVVLALENRFDLYVAREGLYRKTGILLAPSRRATASRTHLIIPGKDVLGEFATRYAVRDESLTSQDKVYLPDKWSHLYFDGPYNFVLTEKQDLLLKRGTLSPWERVNLTEASHKYCLLTALARPLAVLRGEFLMGCTLTGGSGLVVSHTGREIAPADAASADGFGSLVVASESSIVVGDNRRRIVSEIETAPDPHYFIFRRLDSGWQEIQRFRSRDLELLGVTIQTVAAASDKRVLFRVSSVLPGTVGLVLGGPSGEFSPMFLLRIQGGTPRRWLVDDSRILIATEENNLWRVEVFKTD